MADLKKASFGDIIGIGFRIISNRQKIMDMWSELAPVIQNVMAMYPKIKQLLTDVAPELAQAPQATSKAFAPPDGFSVEWLQESLNKLQKAGLTVDGDYGEKTRAAVRVYQEANGLAADGWAGADTSASIFSKMSQLK
jgi:murein L,D-transpeptidase YcbB/YkuD